jgi:hypothetical protein
LDSLDLHGLRGEYGAQGSFLYVENFLPADITAQHVNCCSACLDCCTGVFPRAPSLPPSAPLRLELLSLTLDG